MRAWSLYWLLGCLLLGGSSLAAADDFLTLEDFFASQPRQRLLTEAFREQVQQPARPQPAAQQRPLRIAVVYPGNQQSDYWRVSLGLFVQRLDALELDYRLESYFSRPTFGAAALQKQVKSALKLDPDYLVFTLDSPAHRRIIERILARGRPKLILQNITTPVKDWSGAQPLLYTGFDHQEGARLLAQAFFDGRLGRTPDRISVLFRDRGYVSRMRGQTFIDQLQGRQAQLVSSYYTQSDQDSAYAAAKDALERDPDLDAFYACSTDVALGAIKALREAGRSETVILNGWGGGREELERIRRGELDLSVVRFNPESSIAMAEAIANDQRGEPVPLVYNGSMALLTRFDSQERQEAVHERAFPTDRPPQ